MFRGCYVFTEVLARARVMQCAAAAAKNEFEGLSGSPLYSCIHWLGDYVVDSYSNVAQSHRRRLDIACASVLTCKL
jgi:hypothetical protein